MLNRFLVVCAVLPALALSGCGGLDRTLADMDRQTFQRACADIGITAASRGFEACMLQQQAERRQLLDRMALERAIREGRR